MRGLEVRWSKMIRLSILVVLCALISLSARAQEPAESETTFSASVKVVNVLATAHTKKGEIVRDLTKDDFSLLENGHPQAICYFSKETDLPLTLGLMVDTSMSQGRVLEAERAASFRFIDQVLRAQDKVFVVQFDMAVMIRQQLTASRRELEQSLSLVDTPTRQELSMQSGGGTLLYDAVTKASIDLMAKQQNRKALIILSDGVDTGSETSLNDAIEAAQRTNTLVYSILFSDATYYGGGLGLGRLGLSADAVGRNALLRLSKETGGEFFEVTKKRTIDQIYASIQEVLRSQYNLGYVSDKPVDISEFRKIQLSTKDKSVIVEARTRYWAQR